MHIHRRLTPALAILVGLLFIPQARAQFKDPAASLTRSNPTFMKAFREVVAKPSQSTVRIVCDGKDAALGMVVGPDGWILTKSHDLKGEIVVKLRDGRTFDARWVGAYQEHDIALLKIDATGLTPVEFTESKKTSVGSWIALAGIGDDPAAVGVVSVATRSFGGSVKGAISMPQGDLAKVGYLGVELDSDEGKLWIKRVQDNTPAAKVGLKDNDVVLQLNGQALSEPDQFIREIGKHKPGDVVTLKVRRADKELELKPTLERRPPAMLRGDMQDRMGSELSSRRFGYPTILQHDSVVRPQDCGGPIVDLDGRVIGINICRQGRTASWAVPSEVIQPFLFDMMSGRLPPKVEVAQRTPRQLLDGALKTMKKAEAELARLQKQITDAKAQVALLEKEVNQEALTGNQRPDSKPATAESPRPVADENPAKTVEAVLKLMQQRLALMKDVAGAKWSAKIDIADAKREAELTDQLIKKGQELGLKVELVRGFIGAQLDASRQVQESFFLQWRKENTVLKATADLQKELRPKVDQVSLDLLAALAKLQPHLETPVVQQLLRDRASAILAGDGITEAVRNQALAPLVRR